MSRYFAKALAAVALAWLGGSASAGDPPATLIYQPQTAAPASPAPQGYVAGPSGYAASCGLGCCNQVERGGFYGSAGILYLKQDWTRDLAWTSERFSDVDPTTGDTTLTGTGRDEFKHDWDVAYRFELGYKGSNGLGVRARYFWQRESNVLNVLDAEGVQSDPNFQGIAFNQITGQVFRTAAPLGVGFSTVGTADSPSVLGLTRDLKLQTWDLELTSDCNHGCLEVTYSAGLRWLHIEQGYGASEVVLDPTLIATPDVIPAQQSIRSRHTINGFGPTVGVEGRYPLSGSLKALGIARFGLLYSKGSQTVLGSETPTAGDFIYRPLQALSYGATQERRGVIPTGELEVGAEYGRIIGCNGPELFIRGTVLTNVYWGAGTSARVNFNNNPANEDLIFVGLSATVGIRY